MVFTWQAPTKKNAGNYWGELEDLAHVARLGSVPTGEYETDMYVEDDGTLRHTVSPVHADCTVYIGKNGMLTFELYQGSVSGNPEDGERVTYYHRQCTDPVDARVVATMFGAYYLDEAQYWADYHFEKQEA